MISGKGGTGKTTVVSSLAQLAEYSVLADNDVDAADLHLLIKPEVREAHDFTGSIKCTVNPDACIACGRCAELCHFDAIFPDGPGNGMADATYRIEELICEGCGLCVRVCPVNAISGFPNVTGKWYVSDTNYGPMVHARLGVAEENSGRLVAQVRNKAAELTRELSLEKLLGDGPPGTGCPVIASVTGTDLVVLVTEPTVSGVHDLERVMRLVAQFEVPAAVVINKYDLNLEQTALIEEMAEKKKAKILGRIPFDRSVNDSLMAVQTVVEYGDSPARRAIIEIYENLRSIL
ncbi:MAG: 4Fe-4S binding protein [Lentisphaerae bacterium]|nr:4Fe-4S binding protein [Lentisphaerota bacterium]